MYFIFEIQECKGLFYAKVMIVFCKLQVIKYSKNTILCELIPPSISMLIMGLYSFNYCVYLIIQAS